MICRRREYFETIYPTELKRAAGEQPVPTDLGEARITRRQRADTALFVDIDNDPNVLRFKGHTVPCPRQMVGYERQQQVLWTDRNGVVADRYDQQLADCLGLCLPLSQPTSVLACSTHAFVAC